MWFLKHLKTDEKFYLLMDRQQYIVSRNSNCGELILSADNSISRQHAHIYPANDHVKLIDSTSKYGTFLNELIDANVPIEKNKEIHLKSGDKIRFGRLENCWQLEKYDIVTLTSTLTAEEKLDVRNDVKILNGMLLDNWSEKCNFLTINNLTATIKVLQALAYAIPIVKPLYWKDYIKAVKMNGALPDPVKYLPTVDEEYTKDASFAININRKRIFVNKLFVFMAKRHMIKFEQLIHLAGGTCWSLDEKRMRKSSLTKPNVIVVFYNPSTQSQATRDISGVSELLKQHNRRMVPDCELGLAILHCSTQKFCNPEYRMEDDFDIKKLFLPEPSTILAEQTPTQSHQLFSEQMPRITIPETINSADALNTSDKSDQLLDSFIPEPCQSSLILIESKRKHSPEPHTENPSKKLALNHDLLRKDIQKLPVKSATKSNQRKIVEPKTSSNVIEKKTVDNSMNDWFCSQNIQSMLIVQNPVEKETENTKTINKTVAAPKRGFNMLKDNDNSDDDDNLFAFSGDDPIAKRPRKTPNETNPFDLLSLPSSTQTQSQINGRGRCGRTFNQIANVSNKQIVDFRCYIQPIKITEEGWLNTAFIKQMKVEDDADDSMVSRKEESENDNKETTQKWINSIRNGFQVRTLNLTVRSIEHTLSRINAIGDNSTKKNFKTFVKKMNYRPQTTIIKTIPMAPSLQRSFDF